jgi:hypothetical protein
VKAKVNYKVVVRRANGRPLLEQKAASKYDAKQRQRRLEDKYDESYSVAVEKDPS